MGFHIPKIWKIFEAFHKAIPSSINLIFLKSELSYLMIWGKNNENPCLSCESTRIAQNPEFSDTTRPITISDDRFP